MQPVNLVTSKQSKIVPGAKKTNMGSHEIRFRSAVLRLGRRAAAEITNLII